MTDGRTCSSPAIPSLSVAQIVLSYLGLPTSSETLKLYRNLRNGAFQDVTAQVGLDKVFMPMGSNFGDAGNDGFLDIYLGMGQPSFAALMPHALLCNKNGESFVDVTASSVPANYTRATASHSLTWSGTAMKILLTHSLHTIVIDREGRLAANLEGNQFSPKQLGDLVQTVMNRPND